MIHGDSGVAVVLLPGGAAPCDGFFPGLVAGLSGECRVVVHDRPGTGSAGPGALADATAHLHELVAGLGPVVAVGQSLGGAVATLWARDHPADLAGIVLLDATPIDDAELCRRIERPVAVVGRIARVPLLGGLLERLFQGLARRSLLKAPLPPEGAAAVETTLRGDIPQLAGATRGLAELAAGMRAADLPTLPAAVVTADRRPDRMTACHERLAAAFGTTVTRWPGAAHHMHLDHPAEVLATVREVVSRARRA